MGVPSARALCTYSSIMSNVGHDLFGRQRRLRGAWCYGIAPQMIRGRGAGLPGILPSLPVTSFSSFSSAFTTSSTPWSTPFPVPPSRFLFLYSRWLSCLPSRAAHAVSASSFHEHMSHIVSCSHIVCIALSCSTVITSTSFTKRCISRCINRLHLL